MDVLGGESRRDELEKFLFKVERVDVAGLYGGGSFRVVPFVPEA